MLRHRGHSEASGGGILQNAISAWFGIWSYSALTPCLVMHGAVMRKSFDSVPLRWIIFIKGLGVTHFSSFFNTLYPTYIPMPLLTEAKPIFGGFGALHVLPLKMALNVKAYAFFSKCVCLFSYIHIYEHRIVVPVINDNSFSFQWLSTFSLSSKGAVILILPEMTFCYNEKISQT